MESHLPQLIVDLAIVRGVAALTTLVCRRLKQPAVLGYLLAGLIVGPHVPVPLVADLANVQTMAELGVILVLFSVGLDLVVGLVFLAPELAILLALMGAFSSKNEVVPKKSAPGSESVDTSHADAVVAACGLSAIEWLAAEGELVTAGADFIE